MDVKRVEILLAMVEDQNRGVRETTHETDETENTVECGNMFDAREE